MTHASSGLTLEIVEFRPELAAAFEALNRAWIERDFGVEPADEAAFRDPGGHIVAPGGQILFALMGTEVVGTCALIPHARGVYELAKMAVGEESRGLGIGGRLMAAAIDWSHRAGAVQLRLVTNSRLVPALRLYEKYGFQKVPLDPGGEYTRADVQMILALTP